MTQYIIIGNGVAANTAAENIRKNDKEGAIKIFSMEAVPYYYLPVLPEYMSGEKKIENMILHNTNWYENNNIELFLNTEIISIDTAAKQVTDSDSTPHAYDKLLIATGGYSFVPPITGTDNAGVYSLRTLKDADLIKGKTKTSKDMVLIGGGLLGLEAGNGIRKSGINITVVEFFPRLLPRQMDSAGAAMLQKVMEEMGFKFYLGAKTKEIKKQENRLSVNLESGEEIAADLVLVSAGVRPEMKLAQDIGLETNLGVKVNDQMETGIPDIYAAGDLVEHNSRFYGTWPASMEQGRIAGLNMSGQEADYFGTVLSNTLKVVGIDLTASGEIDADDKHESIVITDNDKNIYRKLVIEDNIIIGTILFGDITGSDKILKAISSKTDISSFKEALNKPDFDFTKL
jgi:nitrite reductase (NADH) large subunit